MITSEDRRTNRSRADLGAEPKQRPALTPGELEIEPTRDRETLTLGLHGELDIASAPKLQRYLRDAQGSGAERVVVDLRDLEFLDSAGLHVLLEAHQRLRAQRRPRMVLRRGRPSIQRFFELTSADSTFEFEPDCRHGASA